MSDAPSWVWLAYGLPKGAPPPQGSAKSHLQGPSPSHVLIQAIITVCLCRYYSRSAGKETEALEIH